LDPDLAILPILHHQFYLTESKPIMVDPNAPGEFLDDDADIDVVDDGYLFSETCHIPMELCTRLVNHDPALTTVDVSHCGVSDDDLRVLCGLLQQNQQVIELDLSGNPFLSLRLIDVLHTYLLGALRAPKTPSQAVGERSSP
jgi:hypothetical protein